MDRFSLRALQPVGSWERPLLTTQVPCPLCPSHSIHPPRFIFLPVIPVRRHLPSVCLLTASLPRTSAPWAWATALLLAISRRLAQARCGTGAQHIFIGRLNKAFPGRCRCHLPARVRGHLLPSPGKASAMTQLGDQQLEALEPQVPALSSGMVALTRWTLTG